MSLVRCVSISDVGFSFSFSPSSFHFHVSELTVWRTLCAIHGQAITNEYLEDGTLALPLSCDIVKTMGDRSEDPLAVSGKKGEKEMADSWGAKDGGNWREIPVLAENLAAKLRGPGCMGGARRGGSGFCVGRSFGYWEKTVIDRGTKEWEIWMGGGWWIEIHGGLRGGSMLLVYPKRGFAVRESLKTFRWAGKSDCLQVRLDAHMLRG
jgi:hypothetical protein